MISLFRMDDRLIHGQVKLGWGPKLNAHKFVIIDDDLEDFEAEMFLACLDNENDGYICKTVDAIKKYKEWLESKDHIILLIKSPLVLQKLADLGWTYSTINIGGLHYNAGKICYAERLYLNDLEFNILKELKDKYSMFYQSLPTDIEVEIGSIIK
jgi:mannose/fructose/N-acetylgalactosamine-specific phosphotransferase system component IIB